MQLVKTSTTGKIKTGTQGDTDTYLEKGEKGEKGEKEAIITSWAGQ